MLTTGMSASLPSGITSVFSLERSSCPAKHSWLRAGREGDGRRTRWARGIECAPQRACTCHAYGCAACNVPRATAPHGTVRAAKKNLPRARARVVSCAGSARAGSARAGSARAGSA
eukprot:2246669-Prymnesium_polylepis.1